jgi:hypothetical protein
MRFRGACVGDGVGGSDDGGFVARCFSRCQVLELGNNGPTMSDVGYSVSFTTSSTEEVNLTRRQWAF